MPDDQKDPDGSGSRREIARATRSLIFIFGAGAIGVGLAVAWVVHSLPDGELPSTYSDGPSARGKEGSKPHPQPCVKFGEPCEYSPGKLGACIERENCTGPDCLFCQSQH